MRNIQLSVVLPISVLRVIALKNLKSALSLILFSTLSLLSFSVLAETSVIPNKGMTQSEVKASFGEPISTKAPVGKPPIARWDYSNYSVYFEGDYVIHSFQHNQRTQPLLNPSTSPAIPTQEQEVKPEPTLEEQASVEKAADQEPVMEVTGEEVQEPVVEEVEVQEIESVETEEAAVEEVETQEIESVETEEAVVEETVEEITEEVEETEKDLNFEEPEKKADFGKWGY